MQSVWWAAHWCIELIKLQCRRCPHCTILNYFGMKMDLPKAPNMTDSAKISTYDLLINGLAP